MRQSCLFVSFHTFHFRFLLNFLCYISLLKKKKDAINFHLNEVRIPTKSCFYDLILYYANILSADKWLINDKNKEKYKLQNL